MRAYKKQVVGVGLLSKIGETFTENLYAKSI